MLLPSFVIRRRQAFFVRVRVPLEIAPIIGKTHICRALGTSRADEARLRAGERYAAIQRGFTEIRVVVERLRITTLDELNALFDEQVWAVDVSPEAVALMPPNVRAALQRRMKALNKEDEASIAATRIEAMSVDTETTRIRNAVRAIEDADYDHARLMLEEARFRRLSEEVARLSAAIPAAPATPVLPPESAQPWPSLIERFFEDRRVGDSAKKTYQQAFREFESLVGPKKVSEVTKANVKTYADYLRDKPNNRRGKSNLDRDTIIKLLGDVNTFFGWAASSGFIAGNPAEGVKARTATQEEKNDLPRRAFTRDELISLFDSPMFTGCSSRSHRSKPGKNVYRDEKYWFWLLALLAGARTEEIAALPSTFVDVGGVQCLDFRHATKTSAGPRLVPVLPELRRLGLDRWANEQSQRGRGMTEGPNASKDWSKWLNRYMDLIGIDDQTVVAYSLRHNFRQQLRGADLHPEIVDKVFGHEGDSVGARYGRDLSPDEARLVVERVKSPVDLTHLIQFK